MSEMTDNEIEKLDDNSHPDGFPGSDEESHLTSNEAIEKQTTDTQPPSPNGFLEQWEMFQAETLQDLEAVCKQGLTPPERASLIKVSLQLIILASIGVKPNEFASLYEEQVLNIKPVIPNFSFPR